MAKRNHMREKNGRGVKKLTTEAQQRRKTKLQVPDRRGSKGNERHSLMWRFGQ